MDHFLNPIYLEQNTQPTVGCKYKKHKLCLGREGRAATDASRAFSIQLDSTGPLKEHCNQCNQREFDNLFPFTTNGTFT